MKRAHIDNMIRGWFIGDFEPSVYRTVGFEVGLMRHTKQDGIRPHLHREVTEYNLVTRGRFVVNGESLGMGDIFIIEPGMAVVIEFLTEEVDVICVKVPSIPSDKEYVDENSDNPNGG
jgi:mannose-6-phosphate isomerase-like protein (cupin superfamily)